MASTHEDQSDFFTKFDFEYGTGGPAIRPPLTFTEYRAELYKRDKRLLRFGLHGGKIKRREEKGKLEPALKTFSLKHPKTVIKAPERKRKNGKGKDTDTNTDPEKKKQPLTTLLPHAAVENETPKQLHQRIYTLVWESTPLPENWVSVEDDGYGMAYYLNEETGEYSYTWPGEETEPDMSAAEKHYIDCCKHNLPHDLDALLREGIDIKYVDPLYCYTGLMWAVCKGHPDCVEVLLSHKCNVNTVTKKGKSALHLACQCNKCGTRGGECAALLVNAGADTTLKDKDGNRPLHYALGHTRLAYLNAKKAREKQLDDERAKAQGAVHDETQGEQEYWDESGGYYDENGQWVDTSAGYGEGYENYDTYEEGEYGYEESGTWVGDGQDDY